MPGSEMVTSPKHPGESFTRRPLLDDSTSTHIGLVWTWIRLPRSHCWMGTNHLDTAFSSAFTFSSSPRLLAASSHHLDTQALLGNRPCPFRSFTLFRRIG